MQDNESSSEINNYDGSVVALVKQLAKHASEIRRLGKRVITDVIEIGRRLSECKNFAGRATWLMWIEEEFGWSEDTAENFIRLNALSDQFPKLSELNLPLSGLYLLAAPSCPDEVRAEVFERAEAGEKLPVAEVKQIVKAAQSSRRHGARNPERAELARIHRELKLGEAIAKIRSTSLDNAREQDELLVLNRGAADGEHTDIVAALVDAAEHGERVSALKACRYIRSTGCRDVGEIVAASRIGSRPTPTLPASADRLLPPVPHTAAEMAQAAREVPIEEVKKAFAELGDRHVGHERDAEIAGLKAKIQTLENEIEEWRETRSPTLSTLIVAARSEYAPMLGDMTAAERTLVLGAFEVLNSTREAIRARRENKAKAKAKADATVQESQAREINPTAPLPDDADVMLADGLPEKFRRTEHDGDRDAEANAPSTARVQ